MNKKWRQQRALLTIKGGTYDGVVEERGRYKLSVCVCVCVCVCERERKRGRRVNSVMKI